MLRTIILLAGIAIGLVTGRTDAQATQATAPKEEAISSCAVTQPILDEPPADPLADPFGFGEWIVNADRSIWVRLPPDGVWRASGEKIIWIRPAGNTLTISGQRLDGAAPPLRADIPCCYTTGFQVTGLYFPAEGCWAVTASAGAHQLHFVTQVKLATDSP